MDTLLRTVPQSSKAPNISCFGKHAWDPLPGKQVQVSKVYLSKARVTGQALRLSELRGLSLRCSAQTDSWRERVNEKES